MFSVRSLNDACLFSIDSLSVQNSSVLKARSVDNLCAKVNLEIKVLLINLTSDTNTVFRLRLNEKTQTLSNINHLQLFLRCEHCSPLITTLKLLTDSFVNETIADL
ncbi:hypothetical protein B4U80_00857 [Leptotrombidium deliense]|uniref:Uncharacterized protein n=1 Tax=Leptotrombidium deliense TaxID=299467 RepID=A0A443SLN6_9ACAR|nr:hypothetical protein B4U80_00857 [Leptotrombidium deliense]